MKTSKTVSRAESRRSMGRHAAPLTPSLSHPLRRRASAASPMGEGGRRPGEGAVSGFTMVEIALCLAIIGFALVAIIGVLPTGLGVQKDNREETIINQEAAVWMDVIRNGAEGYNDLTNYVFAITNYVWHYTWDASAKQYKQESQVALPAGTTAVSSPEIYVFTRTNCWRNGGPVPSSDGQFLAGRTACILSAP